MGRTKALVEALDSPGAFGHTLKYLRLIETHISWIILTGDFAYKIKKPVRLGFLDFSTLEQRRHFCHEELRLNRRFAPDIYLEVIEIRGTRETPRLNGQGAVIDYALKMIEFPQQCLLSHYAQTGQLDAELVDALADKVCELHLESEVAATDTTFGSSDNVKKWSAENLNQIESSVPSEVLPASYHRLKQWYRDNTALLLQVAERKCAGHVRECHGDLHLANIAIINNKVTPFDCIEFNSELRWIDTISEAAFVAMDLQARGYRNYCWRFINRYLEISTSKNNPGKNRTDYDSIQLLRYYFVYRCLVRAKVEALRVDQTETGSSDVCAYQPMLNYIELADQWANQQRPGMIVMHGLSGSGKSTVAAELAETLGAVRIRSDIIRKQIHSIATDANTHSELDAGIYHSEATRLTYRHLQQIAQKIIEAGFCVIIDATFLQEAQRREMLQTGSATTPCARIIINCEAPEAVLRERITTRKNDPSEANLQVLEQQIGVVEPITAAEAEIAEIITVTCEGLAISQIDRISSILIDSDNAR